MDGMVLGVYMDEVWAGYEDWGGRGGGDNGQESKRVRGVQGSNISPFFSLLLRRRASARGRRWWRLCRNRTRCGGLARG